MSFRRRKREIEQQVSQRLKNIESKKSILNRAAGKDLFETVRVDKRFGPVRYEKAGLKIAPAITISLWVFRISFRSIRLSLAEKSKLETVLITIWKFKVHIWNWSVRKSEKPQGAIGNYLITWDKIDKRRSL